MSDLSAMHFLLVTPFLTLLSFAPGLSAAHEDNENYILARDYPLVISSMSTVPDDTHFGFSVSLSNSTSEKGKNRPQAWLFIGAPTANSNDSSYSKKNVSQPGVLWKCSLGRFTRDKNMDILQPDTCDILDIDPIPKPFQKKKRPHSPESEDDGFTWVGGSVEVKNSRMVTCGHRYLRGDSSFLNGICYFNDDTFKKDSTDRNDLVTDDYSHRLNPFFSYYTKDQRFNFTDGRGKIDVGYDWGLGQFGSAIHLMDSNNRTNENPELLVGAPGVRQWSGAVVRFANNPNPSVNRSRLNRNKSDPSLSEFVVGYRGSEKFEQNNHWFEYFGYSVSSGKFFDKTERVYVAGAPRGNNLTGEVVIFQIDTGKNPSNKLFIDPILSIHPPESRNALGSYFGSVILSLDINDDGMDELLVGAPLCTGAQGRRGDHGCVFVYYFNFPNKEMKGEPKVICSQVPEARFGSAISFVKWESKSFAGKPGKFETYIVIGAPYQSSGGSIYIYNSSLSLVQQINSVDIANGINGFGSSISLPQDIDRNETPDLAIGAYKSNQVIILRTHPRITLRGSVKISDDKLGDKISMYSVTIVIIACCEIVPKFGTVVENLRVQMLLDVDERLSIYDVNLTYAKEPDNQYRITLSVPISKHLEKQLKKAQTCVKLTARMNGTSRGRSNETTDQEPLKITQHLWYNETVLTRTKLLQYNVSSSRREVKQSPGLHLNSFGSKLPYPTHTSNTFEAHIAPNDCKDEICTPRLTINASWFHLEDEERKNPISKVTVGSSKNIVLRLNISNENETAIKPVLTFEWDEGLGINPSKMGSKNSFITLNSCKKSLEGSTILFNCRMAKSIRKTSPEILEFVFSLESLYPSGPEVNFTVSLWITPEGSADAAVDTAILLVADSRVLLVGSKLEDTLRNPQNHTVSVLYHDNHLTQINNDTLSVVHKETIRSKNLYSKWRQTFTAHILGSTKVDRIRLSFKLPWGRKVDASTKPLILVHVTPLMSKDNVQCKTGESSRRVHLYVVHAPGSEPVDEVNTARTPVETPSVEHGSSRRKRSNEISEDHKISNITKLPKIKTDEGVLQIDCNDEDTHTKFSCIHIHCIASKVDKFVEIVFEFYMDKDEIDELLNAEGKQKTLVESSGSASIFEGATPGDAKYSDSDVAQTIFDKKVGSVATWIYVVSIIGGTMQLLLIVFILYKCGFFKREAKEQLQYLKAEVRKSMMVPMNFRPEDEMSLPITDGHPDPKQSPQTHLAPPEETSSKLQQK